MSVTVTVRIEKGTDVHLAHHGPSAETVYIDGVAVINITDPDVGRELSSAILTASANCRLNDAGRKARRGEKG